MILADVIDLTKETEDLEYAIALSLREAQVWYTLCYIKICWENTGDN